jgi:isopentenyl diphosphate isomerase/L-lactate dehydrogenase-like FMN-dependent dehydrogenase
MTLRRNRSDLSSIVLRQRVLTEVSEVHLGIELLGRKQAPPGMLAKQMRVAMTLIGAADIWKISRDMLDMS